MSRTYTIEITKGLLLTAEKGGEAFDYAAEEIAEMWAAGTYDECVDVYQRAMLALERIEKGGKALK